MEAKNKNILIGGLLAIVLVMAVGYAAFATQLNINGTANITSTWNVGFDTNKTTGDGVVDVTPAGSETPTGSISYTNAQNASITADLKQPGDKITYTLTILNTGTIAATLTNPVITSTSGGSCEGQSCTDGNIKFTVTNPVLSSLPASTGTTTMTVTAEFLTGATTVEEDTAKVNITFTANQAS